MEKENWLAEQFEAHRDHLQRVAYRMLGATGEADDAVQEAWLRLSRSQPAGIENLGGWLTTVVARVCLDTLRSRKSRREEPLEGEPEPLAGHERTADPEREAELADSVGLALLVVLEALAPAERVAFVLHDMFDLPFEEIAPIVGRSPTAARQLASRARRRVRGGKTSSDVASQRRVVDAFLAAARSGDIAGLLAVLDPDVVLRADRTAVRLGDVTELHGAEVVAANFKGKAQAARPALIDGALGVVVAPQGHLLLVLNLTFAGDRIAAIEVVADRDRLRALDLSALP
ncbi:sigma-70 family RNA polymerase sigma factor [Reyranella soli]|uniref:RNA polymerase sigma factor n=1 Tax=Reyranella soli TaxID=1230389 RepID=A0A512NGT7_9HYPH|nr:sigma-70 family RNA polymerase sigma factor [Reyranella soli]GEP58163.1 RNA polymerase sigma factor [Reyranella soli]